MYMQKCSNCLTAKEINVCNLYIQTKTFQWNMKTFYFRRIWHLIKKKVRGVSHFTTLLQRWDLCKHDNVVRELTLIVRLLFVNKPLCIHKSLQPQRAGRHSSFFLYQFYANPNLRSASARSRSNWLFIKNENIHLTAATNFSPTSQLSAGAEHRATCSRARFIREINGK